ncbi:MAG: hypothetical protein ABSF00_08015 [Candidatus Bathyarchaeia archaeon]|jgi:hypothetical protein
MDLKRRKYPNASESYPLYFERLFRYLKMPAWVSGAGLAVIMGVTFVAADAAANVSTLQRSAEISALLVSVALAPILSLWVRNKGVTAYRNLTLLLSSPERQKLLTLLNRAFDQRRCLLFALVVSTGGVIHHVALSYFEWGRIWWYSVVDIVLVGFVWWFVVASFLWLCVSIAWYSYLASKRVRFRLPITSHTRMNGLESFGTLSIIPAVAWGSVATFGTLSTFDPYVLRQLPQLIILYLSLDFLIAVSSMTAIFALPILGYRAILLPVKQSLFLELDQMIGRMGLAGSVTTVTAEKASKNTYLLKLLEEADRLKEWPLSMSSTVKFLLSYLIPGSVFLARVILLFSFNVQLPL